MKKRTRSWIGSALAWICISACGDDASGLTVAHDAGSTTHVDAGLDAATILGGDAALAMDAASHMLDASSATLALTLHFKAKVGRDDLVCGQDYANQGSSKVSITPRDFRLFVQEVRLITASGAEVPLTFDERLPFQTKQVALLDFTDGEGECTSGAKSSNTIITGTAPAGDYTGLVFVNGVAEALNHSDPTSAPAPLQAPGASWGWALGYRFLMAEVVQQAGTRGDAGAVLDAAIRAEAGGDASVATAPGIGLFHLGSTGCNGTPGGGIHCSNANRAEVRLTGFNVSVSTIVADLGAVFAGADLSTNVQCHGSEKETCGPMFDALGLDLASGASLPTQRVFRVE